MRRVILSLAVGLVTLLPVLAWVDRRSDCPEPPPLKHSFTRWEAECKLKVSGVGSCASMACHHKNEAHGTKGSEYSTWVAVDPHAKAYQTLYKPESVRMHQIMADAFPHMRNDRGATGNALCLKCHGMGADVPDRFQADGAGCERCHGPAEKWRTTHYLHDFDRRTPGFVDTKCDVAARAHTCMKCHVGDASQEVDHVLIAAGHPRLRFEYASYYANYPRHWAALGEKETDPTYEAFTWALGQVVTARSALELLVSRAADGDKEKNWPEFAEYDCTSCHHDLKRDSSRQKFYVAEADRGNQSAEKKAGQLPWGTWYFPLLPTLQRHVGGAPRGVLEDVAALDALMRKKEPPRDQVRERATALMAKLDCWATSLVELDARSRKAPGTKTFTVPQMKAIVGDLAMQRPLAEQGWDGATQVYLGLAAMNQAIGDADAAFARARPYAKPLADVRVGLKKSWEPNARRPERTLTLYDTPNDYFGQLKCIFDGLDGFRPSND